jgi:hypothetical protein
MAEGWEGANETTRTAKCDKCGVVRCTDGKIKEFHAPRGMPNGADHLSVCEDCAKALPATHWHGCGCGG